MHVRVYTFHTTFKRFDSTFKPRILAFRHSIKSDVDEPLGNVMQQRNEGVGRGGKRKEGDEAFTVGSKKATGFLRSSERPGLSYPSLCRPPTKDK